VVNLNSIRYGGADVERLVKDLEGLGCGEDKPKSKTSVSGSLDFEKNLCLDRVSYSYESRDVPVLEGVTLEIKCGESIGIVGSSGSGKSTITDLILGLLSPSSGRILVDGLDIHDHLTAWRQKVAYVPQHIHLMDDTLRHNIAFGLMESEIDEVKVFEAVRQAQLSDFVSSLPQGLETMIGERGMRLSGGERQRVAIARALYRDPVLLIFDEATSALDAQTEQALTQTLRALYRHKTLIIAAHRASTLKCCDRIVFLQNGRLGAQGPMEKLLKENTELQKLIVS
jgi:ATP-binding cassette subfamily C protein